MRRESRRRPSTRCWPRARPASRSSTNTSTTSRSWCTRSSPCAPTRSCPGSGCGWRRWIRYAGFINGVTPWCSAVCCAAGCGAASWGRWPPNCPTPTTRPGRPWPSISPNGGRSWPRRWGGCATTACCAQDIDAPALATGLLAAVEGGYLLSQTAHDPRLMQTSLNAAIAHIMSFAPDSAGRTSR